MSAAVESLFIYNHTTSSTPQPHVVYIINVVRDNGNQYEVFRRYSEASPSIRCAYMAPNLLV